MAKPTRLRGGAASSSRQLMIIWSTLRDPQTWTNVMSEKRRDPHAIQSYLLGFGAIAATLLAIWKCASPEDYLRYGGLALQVLGLYEVIRAIDAENPITQFLHRLGDWARRLFRMPPKPRVMEATGSATVAVGAWMDGYVVVPAGNSPTLGSLAQALDRNVEVLHSRIEEQSRQARKLVDERMAKVSTALEALQRALNEGRQEMVVIQQHQARITWRSSCWLLLGVIASTIPGELIVILQRLVEPF